MKRYLFFFVLLSSQVLAEIVPARSVTLRSTTFSGCSSSSRFFCVSSVRVYVNGRFACVVPAYNPGDRHQERMSEIVAVVRQARRTRDDLYVNRRRCTVGTFDPEILGPGIDASDRVLHKDTHGSVGEARHRVVAPQ